MKNRYVNRAKINEAKFRDLVRFFVLDLTAIQIAEITGLNRNTVNRYLTEVRKKIYRYTMLSIPPSLKTIKWEVVEKAHSYCILVKENDTTIIAEIFPAHLIESGISEQIHAFGFDVLIDTESGNHTFIGDRNLNKDLQRIKVNRIKSFWSSAKSRLAKFKGMHSSTFRLHVKECEFRYNNRNEDLYQLLLKILRKDPLF